MRIGSAAWVSAVELKSRSPTVSMFSVYFEQCLSMRDSQRFDSGLPIDWNVIMAGRTSQFANCEKPAMKRFLGAVERAWPGGSAVLLCAI